MTEANEPTASPVEDEPKTGEDGSEKPDGFELFRSQLREVADYAAYYLSAKADRFKVSVRTAVLYLLLAALGFVVSAGFMIVAGWFAVLGLAGGLAQLFQSAWLGNLVSGLLVLLGSAATILITTRQVQHRLRDRTIESYENRQRKQQSAHGHNVTTRAGESDQTTD